MPYALASGDYMRRDFCFLKTLSPEYHAYLESQHWADLRQAAFDRANRKCEACNATKGLHGHHLRYAKRLEDCTVDDIMALCTVCHDLWHKWHDDHRNTGSFTREETRGAILVLKTLPKKKEQSAQPYPTYIPLPKPQAAPSKSERKRMRKAAKLAKRAALRAQRALIGETKTQRHLRRETVQKLISSDSSIQAIIAESKTREDARRRMNQLSKGWPNRALIMHWSLKTWEDRNSSVS